MGISKDFSGTILDFGCGLGDAFPLYKNAYPNATLIGVDISEEAIIKCEKSYGNIASFICGTELDTPKVDIIISSNVFEHLTDDLIIAEKLKRNCNTLFIIVPFKENLSTSFSKEHVNSYDADTFTGVFKSVSVKTYRSKGWGENNQDLFFKVYIKNIGRFLLRKKLRKKVQQIMFKIQH